MKWRDAGHLQVAGMRDDRLRVVQPRFCVMTRVGRRAAKWRDDKGGPGRYWPRLFSFRNALREFRHNFAGSRLCSEQSPGNVSLAFEQRLLILSGGTAASASHRTLVERNLSQSRKYLARKMTSAPSEEEGNVLTASDHRISQPVPRRSARTRELQATTRRRVYIAMIDRKPRLIARCADVADVIAAVRMAKANACGFRTAASGTTRQSDRRLATNRPTNRLFG